MSYFKGPKWQIGHIGENKPPSDQKADPKRRLFILYGSAGAQSGILL
jgi:hypothetical protein